MEADVKQRKNSVIRSALGMAVGTFSSRILGFIRDALMFALFPRAVTDAFVVAFRLPNLFRRLLGEGSISVGFIPLFIETRNHSAEEAARLAGQVFAVIIGLSLVISVSCFVYMDSIIWALVGDKEGFAADPGQIVRTVYLARIMIFYLVLVSTYAFHTAVANALGEFFWPAVGPTLFNFGLILFTLLPVEMGPYPGSSQAWGVIFGGVLQAGVVLWLLVRIGHPPTLSWSWGPGVGRVFREMLPGTFSLGVLQIVTLLNTKFAAPLALGAQSYLYLADRVLELPQSLIAVSLGSALLPRFSELQTGDQRAGFLREAEGALRVMLFLSLPAAVGMFVLSEPITSVLFGRGAFGIADTTGTARVVEVYSLLLLVSGVSRLLTPAFYAAKYIWLPALLSLVTLGFHVLLAPWMVKFHGLQGLAFTTTMTLSLNVLLLGVFFHGKIGALNYRAIGFAVLRMIPACVVLGGFCWLMYDPFLGLFLSRTVALGLVIGGGVILYFLAAYFSGSEECAQVFRILRRRKRPVG